MERLSKKNIQKIGIIIGIVIFIIGLVLNSILPSDFSRANIEPFTLAEDEYQVTIFDPGINQIDYDLKIDLHIYITGEPNCTVLILNLKEYEKFLAEDSLDNVSALNTIDGQYEPRMDSIGYVGSFSSKNSGVICVLIVNFENISEIEYYGYYYTISTPMFFYGAIIMLIGVIIVFSFLTWYLNGWQRYFAIGVGINLSLFIAHIPIMPYLFNETPMLMGLQNIFDIELYRDFEAYYLGWTKAFTSGVFPYSEQYFSYYYGPLFILTLGSFAYLPIPCWSVAIPLFLSTIGSGYLILLISRQLTKNEKFSIFAMMLFFINPFTLMYASFIWLNPPIFTVFILLSFYLALIKKNYLSILILAIGTMYKQYAIIFFPLILLMLIKNHKGGDRKSKLKLFFSYLLIYGATILAISLPFLIFKTQSYIELYIINISFSFEFFTTLNFYPNWPTHFNSFFLLIGVPDIIIYVIAYMLVYYVLLGGSFGLIYLSYAKSSKYKKIMKINSNHSHIVEALFLSIFLIISFQLFYPRGFKYNLILLTPFISIFFNLKDLHLLEVSSIKEKNFKFHKKYFIPLLLSWIVFLCFKHIYFLILIAWCLLYIYYNYIFKKKYIKEFKKMTRSDEKINNIDELPRPGSTIYNFHFQRDELKKKKLKRWQKLNKYFMIPLYRARILPLLGFGRIILLLKTTGWKTGEKRLTPLEYRTIDGNITIFSAMGEKSIWVKNLRANPEKATVRKGFHHFIPNIEFITDVDQKISIIKSYVTKFGRSSKMLFGWNPKQDDLKSINFLKLVNLLSIIKLHELT